MTPTVGIKKRKNHRMASIPVYEIVTAQKDLSAKAYALLMYYYSKDDYWDWEDINMATELGWSKRQVKDYRRELIKKDYLFIVKGKITNVFIGRKAVMEFKMPMP